MSDKIQDSSEYLEGILYVVERYGLNLVGLHSGGLITLISIICNGMVSLLIMGILLKTT